MSKENGIYKDNRLLLLDIDRPLPFGTRITYLTPSREVRSATVVQAGYYCIVVYNEDNSISVIWYTDLVAVG